MANGQPGAPSKYDPKMDEQAYRLCLLGATDKELADFFGVCEASITNWKQEYPTFLASLKRGKVEADANVAERLYKRALGYEHEDTHISMYQGEIIETPLIKHYPPDTGAACMWLKNRTRNRDLRWSDQKEVTGANGEPLIPKPNDDTEAARRMLFLLRKGLEAEEDAKDGEG